MKATDCPTCGRTLHECQESRAKGWDNCCMTCDEFGQVKNHATLTIPAATED